MMKTTNEKIPDPKELEKEISEFLSKKFGNNIRIVSPEVLPQEAIPGDPPGKVEKKTTIAFDLKPEDLVAHLDQYIIKQDSAKAILSTKICTHFNRVKQSKTGKELYDGIVGGIKNNVLMIGPTGVGKTYMIRLIAKKIGVPFVKGDATKFSETGYVGGDVEDLVRDLVREADDDIELAECGIIYIDEIDKIASSRHLIGADVSRTGVQRALLKPMEETEVDLKVPHDPISMLQEVERFRKSGKRDKRVVNTRNILFIMSGAFTDLTSIVAKRTSDRGIGFGAKLSDPEDQLDLLRYVTAEDLAQFGFESEFVGRLPVIATLNELSEESLVRILTEPRNALIKQFKKLFEMEEVSLRFTDSALAAIAEEASKRKSGARGLRAIIESCMLDIMYNIPSVENVKECVISEDVVLRKEDPILLYEQSKNSAERTG